MIFSQEIYTEAVGAQASPQPHTLGHTETHPETSEQLTNPAGENELVLPMVASVLLGC